MLSLVAVSLVACTSGGTNGSIVRDLTAGTGAAGARTVSGTGGLNIGGVSTGGLSTGGLSTGGFSAGAPSRGGLSMGGTSAAGVSTGGTSAGGLSTGGVSAGDSSARGGTGGAGTGGVGAGGAGTGGVGAAGSSGRGGAGASGSGPGGGTGGTSTGGAGGTLNCSGASLTGGTAHCSSNDSGNAGSYAWSIWSSGSGGCITPYGVGAAFKATWNNAGDFLAREGFQWNETKTYDQYGTISADYAYTKTGSAGGYSYIGIYGWSNNPLIEFYIVDDWYGSGPPTGGGALKGSFDIDGGTYKIYTHTQTNQPSIHGTATFVQFFSVRQTARQCGHISITEHFKKWAGLGMKLGNMYEAKLLVEAGGGNGSIDFKTGTMTAQ